jgi:hypothetical protein
MHWITSGQRCGLPGQLTSGLSARVPEPTQQWKAVFCNGQSSWLQHITVGTVTGPDTLWPWLAVPLTACSILLPPRRPKRSIRSLAAKVV